MQGHPNSLVHDGSSDFSSALNPPPVLPQLPGDSASAQRKRKIDRACDTCRRRKTKCDGPKRPNNICSNCIASNKSCTYVEESKPRGPPKAYITSLEDRVEKLEALLKRIRPDTDFSEQLGPPVIRDSWKNDESPTSASTDASKMTKSSVRNRTLSIPGSPPNALFKRPLSPIFGDSTSLSFSTHLMFEPSSPPREQRSFVSDPYSSGESSEASSSDFDTFMDGPQGMSRLTLKGSKEPKVSAIDSRFHGRSSTLPLIDATRKFKQLHISDSASEDTSEKSSSPALPANSIRRPQFWVTPHWENRWEGFHLDSQGLLNSVLSEFPPPSLASSLLHLYFNHVNSQFPALHRPTFMRQWKERLHERNIWFSCLCMAIFSVASRWSDDPRVLPKDERKRENGELDWTRAGLDYHRISYGIHQVRRSLLYPATLFEIQTFSVLAMYLRGTTSPTDAWMVVSVGIRKAQDVGAHKRTVYSNKPSVEEELWRRAFWLLVAFERIDSASLGRSCGIGEEDFDLDLPTEVDDEYWEHEDPSQAFRQGDVPCKITAFNLWLKLTQIIGFALKTIYAVDTSRTFLGRFARSRRDEIVDQLNIALTRWVDSVPEYLRWSNQSQNRLFSNQSATLYTTYYLAQILIYSPFIPSPLASPFLRHSSFPALAICSNAAKSCAKIVEAQLQRGMDSIPNLAIVSYICAAILLVNVWNLKAKERAERAQGIEDVKPVTPVVDPLMADVSVFIRALEWAKPRFGHITPMLQQLRQSMPGSDAGNMEQAAMFDQDTSHSNILPVPHAKLLSPPCLQLQTNLPPFTPPSHSWQENGSQSAIYPTRLTEFPRPSLSPRSASVTISYDDKTRYISDSRDGHYTPDRSQSSYTSTSHYSPQHNDTHWDPGSRMQPPQSQSRTQHRDERTLLPSISAIRRRTSSASMPDASLSQGEGNVMARHERIGSSHRSSRLTEYQQPPVSHARGDYPPVFDRFDRRTYEWNDRESQPLENYDSRFARSFDPHEYGHSHSATAEYRAQNPYASDILHTTSYNRT